MLGISVALVIKSFIFLMIFLYIMIMTGRGLSKLCGKECDVIESAGIGFVFQLAAIQFVGWPFIAFRWSSYGFIAIVVVFSVLGIIIGNINKDRKKFGYSLLKDYSLTFAMLLFMIILTFLMYRSDADDSFYVSNVTLFQNSGILNPYDSSFGIENIGTVPMYDFQIWEAYISVFCRIFRIEAVTMMHTVLPPALLCLSASAYLFLGKAIWNKDNKKKNWFFIFISIFHLMGGYAVYSQGSFLLSRLWQGKAVYLHIVLPIMMGFMVEIPLMKNEIKKVNFFSKSEYLLLGELTLCILAGIALNPTSLYVLGFQVLAMILAITICRKRARTILTLLPSLVIILFFTIMIYIRTSQFDGQIEAASIVSDQFVLNTFKDFWGTGILYVFFYILAYIFILKLGNAKAKIMFVYTPLILLLLVWNPITGNFVAENVTKGPSYWRVFWLLPVGLSLSYTIVEVSFRLKEKRFWYYTVLLAGAVCIALPGTWMFTKGNGFYLNETVERIPTSVLELGEVIVSEEEQPVVLGPDIYSTTLRQKFPQIELIFSRYQYILDLFQYRGDTQGAEERVQLMNFANGVLDDEELITELLQSYQVDFVILNTSHTAGIEFMGRQGAVLISQSGEYLLYKLQ